MTSLMCAAVLAFGGLYHAVLGPEIITSAFFEYRWNDRNAMTSILGIHLLLLGSGALLLVAKAVLFGGLYDPWAPGGGDVRTLGWPSINPSWLGWFDVSHPGTPPCTELSSVWEPA